MNEAVINGAWQRMSTSVYHHGRYSFNNPKNDTVSMQIDITKIRMAMNKIPHLIGKQPKQVASLTLSWLQAQRQQQHGVRLCLSGLVSAVGSLSLSSHGFFIFKRPYFSSSSSSAGAWFSSSGCSALFCSSSLILDDTNNKYIYKLTK